MRENELNNAIDMLRSEETNDFKIIMSRIRLIEEYLGITYEDSPRYVKREKDKENDKR